MKRQSIFIAAAGTAGAIAALTLAAPAAASPHPTISFASDPTSSAGWVGPGHSAFHLTIGNGPSSSVFAVAVLHHFASDLPSTGPTFTTDNYNSGSPRFYIALANNAYLFGYPSNSGLNGSDVAWSVNNCGSVNPNTYTSYADAKAAVLSNCSTNHSVSAVQVIADGDQSAGTTDTITALQYDGITLTSS